MADDETPQPLTAEEVEALDLEDDELKARIAATAKAAEPDPEPEPKNARERLERYHRSEEGRDAHD